MKPTNAAGIGFHSTKSFGTTITDYVNVVLEGGVAVLKGTNNNNLLFPLLLKKLFRIKRNDEELKLLNWDDLRLLQNKGHSIGNHSSFHYQVNKLSTRITLNSLCLCTPSPTLPNISLYCLKIHII